MLIRQRPPLVSLTPANASTVPVGCSRPFGLETRHAQSLLFVADEGGSNCPHLRGVPAAVPHLWLADANHRRHPANTGAHQGGGRASAYYPGTRAATVASVWYVDGRGRRR
jgi:hypothetical protein